MFRPAQTRQQKGLNRRIKKYVRQGYQVQSKGYDHASLYRPKRGCLAGCRSASVQLMTLGIFGRDNVPNRHETIYIYADENGKTSVTKGKAKT